MINEKFNIERRLKIDTKPKILFGKL